MKNVLAYSMTIKTLLRIYSLASFLDKSRFFHSLGKRVSYDNLSHANDIRMISNSHERLYLS